MNTNDSARLCPEAQEAEVLRVRSAVASAVRERMGRLNWNNKALSDASGVPTSSISNYLSEKRDIPQPQLFAIAAALNVRPGALLDRAMEILDEHERD